MKCEDEHHRICSLYMRKHVAGDMRRIMISWRFNVSKGYLAMADGYHVLLKATVYYLANWYRRHRLARS